MHLKLTGATMSTSIITTTTFTFATIIDVRPSLSSASTPVGTGAELEESDIAACEFAALPRCGWTARKHCGHKASCES